MISEDCDHSVGLRHGYGHGSAMLGIVSTALSTRYRNSSSYVPSSRYGRNRPEPNMANSLPMI